MLVSKYGLKQPARINYGADDPGPRAIVSSSSKELLRYPVWILEKPDGTQVSLPGIGHVYKSREFEGTKRTEMLACTSR